MRVRDIMTPNVESCTRTTDLAAAAMIMWRNDCGIVPVVDDRRRVIGVITDRDICMALATRHRRAEEVLAGDVIGGAVHTARPEDTPRRAMDVMREHQVRRLPVTDADGVLQGIVSLNDLVLHAEPSRPRGAVELPLAEVFGVMATVCGHRGLVPRAEPLHEHLVGA